MAELEKRYDRKVELNERVTETQYDILYPVTLAEYVTQDKNLQFVTEEQKEKWDALAAQNGLVWKGTYTKELTYSMCQVVIYNGKYYISKDDNNKYEPTDNKTNDDYWYNLNLEAYAAYLADTVKVDDLSTDADVALLLQGGERTGDTGYYGVGVGADITYNPSTKQLKVGSGDNLIILDGSTGEITGKIKGMVEGKADEAGKADTADYAEVANQYVVSKDEEGNITSASIKEKFDAVEKTIEGIQGGGTFTANDLTIKVEGKDDVVFNGSEAAEVEIKQVYSTEDITDLLDTNKKIKETWLPDTILGQLSYQGTWDPATGDTSITPKTGDYYIANGNGNKFPDGTAQAEGAEKFEQGDWAVYNGTSWDKVDNTDAVRTVNGQIGNVETYKGAWTAGQTYYKGDIVKNDSKLYICHTDHTAATSFVDTNWDLFGRTYTGDEIITISGDSITHKKYTDSGTSTESELKSGESIDVPVLTRDSYGHITKIDVNKVKLSADFIDTVRPVAVNGTEVLTSTQKDKALNIVNGNKIEVAYDNDQLAINHEATKNGELDLTVSSTNLTLAAGGKFQVPSISVDAYGHITAGAMKEFTMAASPITHEHFNVVDENGIQNIRAYTAAVADSTWLANTANKGKFYWGDADTLRVNAKWGATELYQGANKVVDQSAKIYSGNNQNGDAISGSWNDDGFVLGDSGALANGATDPQVYSAVSVNKKGIVVAGGQIIEFGTEVNANPSSSLAVGGLFFRKLA